MFSFVSCHHPFIWQVSAREFEGILGDYNARQMAKGSPPGRCEQLSCSVSCSCYSTECRDDCPGQPTAMVLHLQMSCGDSNRIKSGATMTWVSTNRQHSHRLGPAWQSFFPLSAAQQQALDSALSCTPIFEHIWTISIHIHPYPYISINFLACAFDWMNNDE